MQYALKNGVNVLIRPPVEEDAAALIDLMIRADEETPFLGRNPGEFHCTIELEQDMIADAVGGEDHVWFVAEYAHQVVGMCSISRIRHTQRFRHRAELSFVLLQAYWGLGIGGKMMQHCIQWANAHEILQLELEVVTSNERAIHMYQGFDFQITGTHPRALRYPDGSFADEYSMVKQL